MKTKPLIVSLAIVVSALAFAATAEAGPRYRSHCNDGYRGVGWNNWSHYQQPVRCYQPVRYVAVPTYGYYRRPAVQIGFSFGGNNGYRGGCR